MCNNLFVDCLTKGETISTRSPNGDLYEIAAHTVAEGCAYQVRKNEGKWHHYTSAKPIWVVLLPAQLETHENHRDAIAWEALEACCQACHTSSQVRS